MQRGAFSARASSWGLCKYCGTPVISRANLLSSLTCRGTSPKTTQGYSGIHIDIVAAQPPRDRTPLMSLTCHRVHPHHKGVKRQRLLPEGPALHPFMPQHLQQVGQQLSTALQECRRDPSEAIALTLPAFLNTQQPKLHEKYYSPCYARRRHCMKYNTDWKAQAELQGSTC